MISSFITFVGNLREHIQQHYGTPCIVVTSHWLYHYLFMLLAATGPALGILGATYSGCDRVLVVTFFTGGMGLMGAFVPSLKVNCLDLSPNYAGTLMALVGGVGAVSGIITPYLVGLLTPNVSTYRGIQPLFCRTLYFWWLQNFVTMIRNVKFALILISKRFRGLFINVLRSRLKERIFLQCYCTRLQYRLMYSTQYHVQCWYSP